MNYDRIPTRHTSDPIAFDLGHHTGRSERIRRETALLLLAAALIFAAGVVVGWLARALYAPALAPGWAVLMVLAIVAVLASTRRRTASSEVRDGDV